MSIRAQLIQKIVDSKTTQRWIKKYSKTCIDNHMNNLEKDAYPLTVNYSPKIINIELTNKCIMKCCMCPRTYAMTREQGFMDLELFKKVIDEYASFNVITEDTTWLHHFGESLLHPQFDEAIAYGRSKGLRIGLSLNPLALTEEKAERLFKAKPSEIYFMMDGNDNESFYQIRGVKDAYDISLKNAIKGLEIKEKYSPETKVTITVIDNPAFKENVDAAEKFWKEKYDIQIDRKNFTTWNGSVDEITGMTCIPKYNGICNYPWSHMCVTWDGLVVPCCTDYNNLHVVGDFKKETLREIWNNAPMQNLRDQLKTGKVTSKLCEKCLYTKHEGLSQDEEIKAAANINSYSQFGEDLILDFAFMFLNNRGLIKETSYLDIGGNMPYKLSNTFFLYRKGISGVIIEPNRILAEEFKKSRPLDKVLTIGIHFTNDEITEIPFYQFNYEANGLSTFSKEIADNSLEICDVATHYDVIPTKVKTINQIIKKYFNNKAPTLISLDVEGIDYEILKTVNFQKYRPVIWCIETLSTSQPMKKGVKDKQIIDFMLSKDYIIYADTHVNTIFMDRTIYEGMN